MKFLVLLTFVAALCALAYAHWDSHIYWDPVQGKYVQDQGPSMGMAPNRGFPYAGLMEHQGQPQRPIYVAAPQHDMAFATTLLNVARQTCDPGISSSEATDDTMVAQEAVEKSEQSGSIENKEIFKWSDASVTLLLEEYRLQEPSMLSGKISHAKAWQGIAATMKKKGHEVSGKQCMTRINTMKRTYKTIKDHNARSGSNRRTWKYYEIMESLLGQKPYMNPVTTISSTGCSSGSGSEVDGAADGTAIQVSRKRKATDALDKLIESRQVVEKQKQKRHKERMEMQQKLLDALGQFVL